MKRVVVFAGALSLTVAGVALIVLGSSGPDLIGSNGVAPVQPVVAVGPTQTACMADQNIDRAVSHLAVEIGGSQERPGELRASVRQDGRTLMAGVASSRPGRVPFRLLKTERILPPGPKTVCVTNLGIRRVELLGIPGAGEIRVNRGGDRVVARFAIAYPADSDPTWLGQGGPVAAKFKFLRWAPLGPATFWAALALALAAALLAVTATVIGSRGEPQ